MPMPDQGPLKTKEVGYYLPALKRRLSIEECGRLHGIPLKLMKEILKPEDPTHVGAGIGDGMSINVLCKVLLPALYAVGLVSKRDVAELDPWSTSDSGSESD